MKKYAIIRDDDLNYFCNQEDIESAYESIIGKVPINLFIVPLIRNPKESYKIDEMDYYWKKMEFDGVKSIFDNCSLMSYLKKQYEKGDIDIGLHGIHHTKKEMEQTLSENKIVEALKKIKDTIGKDVVSISAPNNSVGIKGERNIINLLDFLFVSFSHKFWERRISLNNAKWFLVACYAKLIGKHGLTLFKIRKINGKKEISSLPISSAQSNKYVDKILAEFLEGNGVVLCLATHFYDLRDNEKTKKMMLRSIQKLQENNVKFISLTQLENNF